MGQPATAAFVVDTTPPYFSQLSAPGATNRSSLTVTFVAEDAG